MTIKIVTRFLALVFFVALSAQAQNAYSQTWPTRPVRLVVANAPGSTTDLTSRIFANSLSKVIGQPVVIENRPGADGYIAAQAVASSAPDGYTLFFATHSMFAINPHTKKSMPVDPVKDFTPIAVTIDDIGPTGLFANPSMPFKTLQELLAHAKANPGKVTFATSAPLPSMLGAWVNKRAGVNMLEVPYKIPAQASTDVMSGQVNVIYIGFAVMEQYLKAGKLRGIAVTEPVADYPQIASFNSIWPDFDLPSFLVLVGPGGMAESLVSRIHRATATVVEHPSYNRELESLRWRLVNGARTPQGTAEFIRDKRAAWGRFIKEIGLKPE